MATQPLPAEKIAEVEALIREGVGRNVIVKQTGVGAGKVSQIARAAGLLFERSAPAAAVAAANSDNAAWRALAIAMLYKRAIASLEQMDQPHIVFAFGGKDNTYNEHTLDRPPTGDIKNLMIVAGIAIQRAADLERFDAPDSADGVKSMLAGLGRALGVTPSD